MPRPAAEPPSLLGLPFRGTDAIRRGLLTPEQLRSRAWRRLFRDVYLHRDVPVTHVLRASAAASLVLPGAVVSGTSAAAFWGVDLAGTDDDVVLTLPPGRHPVRASGLAVRRVRLARTDVLRRHGVLTTTPVATALDLARRLSGDDAVVAVDRFLAAGLVDLPSLRARAAEAAGRGSARARGVCELADERSESPQETRVRLLVARSGLPAPVPQFTVRVDGRFVARVDLAWPQVCVAVEYDGRWHAEPGQFARDRQRLNRLQAAGWRVVFVTAEDLYRPEELVVRIARALADAASVRSSGSRDHA
ncbi:endonuclease domain-containing protein [Geodermatophilus sp. URMC 62]|uniref:endonuclease domain-containing protein n=1 Tax=Geodermatophilus sp. URMC 62 TaxID=3423414 RepID=UPI00406CCD9F